MSVTIADASLPRSFIAGDSVEFTIHNSSYPATDGWTAAYIIAAATPVSFAGSADGDDHDIAITAEDSAEISYGRYSTAIAFTRGSERKTVGGPVLVVLPNPASAITPTYAMETLTLVEAAIKKVASAANAMVAINGQQFTKADLGKLMAMRNQLIAEVGAELLTMGRPGRGGVKTIHTRFVAW